MDTIFRRLKASVICLGALFIAVGGNFQVYATDTVTYLTAEDFEHGTYRIKSPGTYVLTENITFNAKLAADGSNRNDIPVNGAWFAAISIESDDVILDGDGHTLEESEAYINRTPFGVFSLVLLGNNSFAGALFNTAGSLYPDTPSYVAANNVVIKNIKLGLSSHFGIRGSNNSNVLIQNIVIKDAQSASINLQGPQGLTIQNSVLYGSSKPVTINMETAQLALMRAQFEQLIALNVPGAAEQYAALNDYVAQHPERFNVSTEYPSTLYGILIGSGVTTPFRFPMNSGTKFFGEQFTDGRPAKNIIIKNIVFYDFETRSNERVVLSTKLAEETIGFPLIYIILNFSGLFGHMQWHDLFDNGQYNPNEFVKSLAYLFNGALPTLRSIPGLNALFPPAPAYENILESILMGPSGSALFFNSANPLPGMGDDGNYMKGLFGIRMIGASNVKISNIIMSNFHSSGPAGIDPVTLPGYNDLPPASNRPFVRFQGNDAWFMSFEVSDNISLENIYLSGIKSDHGYAFGIDLAQENSNFDISKVLLEKATAESQVVSNVTELGEVFGISVFNETGPINLKNVLIRKLSATGEIEALPQPSPNITLKNVVYVP